MAESRGGLITAGVVIAIMVSHGGAGNNSKVGQAGTRITNGAARVAEKASGFMSNPPGSSSAAIPSGSSSAPSTIVINPSGPGESVSANGPATVAISSGDGGMNDLWKNVCGPRSQPRMCAGAKPNAAQIAAGIR